MKHFQRGQILQYLISRLASLDGDLYTYLDNDNIDEITWNLRIVSSSMMKNPYLLPGLILYEGDNFTDNEYYGRCFQFIIDNRKNFYIPENNDDLIKESKFLLFDLLATSKEKELNKPHILRNNKCKYCKFYVYRGFKNIMRCNCPEQKILIIECEELNPIKNCKLSDFYIK